MLDGFCAFWKERAQPATAADLQAGATRAAGQGFSAADLGAWLSFSQRVGAADAQAVAWSGLRTLARRHGAAAGRSFLHTVLAPEVALDARATLRDWVHPVNAALATAAGLPFARCFAEWQEDIAALRAGPPPVVP